MNISKKDIQWSLKLACDNKLLQEGVFKFLQKDGTPYPTTGSQGTCGKLEPNQTEAVCIMFSPGEWLWSFSFLEYLMIRFVILYVVLWYVHLSVVNFFMFFKILVLSGEIICNCWILSEKVCLWKIILLFGLACSSDRSLCFETSVPVILDGDFDQHYCHIDLVGEVKVPTLTFDPPSIVMSPTPLDIEISTDFNVVTSYYTE